MKVAIPGYKGRVGQLLSTQLESGAWPDLSYCGGFEQGDDPTPIFEKADAIIDFTVPEATSQHIDLAVKHQTKLIIGTTGLDNEIESKMQKAAETVAILYAANMSVGVNLILALVEQAASRLDIDWDIEIFETHHKHKIDSPSGTALALGKAARSGRGSGDFVTDRAGKRQQGDIGYAVQRGGDIVGEHTVSFFSQGERIEIGHKASDRSLFAKGALQATNWLKDKSSGLYTMRDVLSL